MKQPAPALHPAGSPRARQHHRGDHWRAVGLMLLTVACFAAFDTLSKVAIGFAPVTQTLWVRYAVQAVGMTLWWAVWLRPTLGLRFFRTEHPRFHLARGLLLISCTATCFIGLRYMPVGEFTAVAFVSPMLAMMFSGWFLRERVSAAQWWFAALSFAGAVIVIRPGAGVFGWVVVFPLLMATLNAVYQLITRRLATSANEHPVFAQWASGWIGAVLVAPLLLLPDTWTNDLAPAQWAVMVGMGLLGMLGHFFFMHAVALASAAALAPYTYMQIAFAMAGGWLVFAHTPDAWAIAGMLVIGLSGFVAGMRRARQMPPPASAH